MTESRVAEIMALTDELTEWMRDHEIPMDDQIGRVFDRLARLESALREPVEMSDELPPLPEPFATRVGWNELPHRPGEGSWHQWHDANDPVPTEWDDRPPDTVEHVYTAEQVRAIIAAAGGRK